MFIQYRILSSAGHIMIDNYKSYFQHKQFKFNIFNGFLNFFIGLRLLKIWPWLRHHILHIIVQPTRNTTFLIYIATNQLMCAYIIYIYTSNSPVTRFYNISDAFPSVRFQSSSRRHALECLFLSRQCRYTDIIYR